ncbi:acyl-CoA thioesterase [Pseudoalteromonas piratica]|uniref:Thioesterase n=1 Tax=Pseudoalteromonas piratica TaxID=1348114 RepID=A0A0A7EKT0_9GAMM|nr:thioesterase family protein [Pseudoalteromonas piratica]AIY67254.1 thioesterase [Pseudoalteromonas piratica]
MNNRNAILTKHVEIDVPFHDCDPMQVVWHGNYARYFEVARCALLREFDYDYDEMAESGFMWPIIDMRCKYIKPARFRQTIVVSAYLKEYENRLKIDYIITCKDTGAKLTKGYSIQVAVSISDGEMQYVSPPALIEKLAKVINA